MIPTYFLYQLADYEGIKIDGRYFDHMEGLYTYTTSMATPVIALSNSLNTNERSRALYLATNLATTLRRPGTI